MKRTKAVPVPQKEFGFAKDVFNLFHDWTSDGERLERERAEAEHARQRAAAAEAPSFQIKA